MIIRNATIQDLPVIVSIYNSTIAGRMVTADTEPVSVESRLGWFQSHIPDKYPLWVVEQKSEIIGWISFKPFYGRPAYAATAEVAVYLHPESRGKGLGKQLLEYVIQKSPELGLRSLLGFIFGHNLPSLKLFEQAGFSRWGHLPGVAIIDNEPKDLVIMGKHLI